MEELKMMRNLYVICGSVEHLYHNKSAVVGAGKLEHYFLGANVLDQELLWDVTDNSMSW